MIYFVQDPDHGAIKIGHSDKLDVRLVALRTAYGRKLVLLATVEGNPDDERATHERFARLRIGTTEQFRPGPELTDHLGQPRFLGWEKVQAMEGREAGRVHPLQMRLTVEDLEMISIIRGQGGFTTNAEAIRYALHRVANHSRLVFTDERRVSPGNSEQSRN